LIYRDAFLIESQALAYASRRNCIKSRELNKKMVRWNDPATCDAAELGDPALVDVAGAFDMEGDVLVVGAPVLDDDGVVAGDEEDDDVLVVGAPELDDEGVVEGDEVEVVITDVGVPGVVDEGAAAGLWVVGELGVASA
jgi:hypothetical protein